MKLSKRLILALLSIALAIPMVTAPGNHQQYVMIGGDGDASQTANPRGQPDSTTPQSLHSSPLVLSQDTISGALNPAQVRHSGYQVSDVLRARTDTGTNAKRNITIDEPNGWFAGQAEVEVTDSRRLYALNGTFETGVQPWVSSTYDPSGGDQDQTAAYNSTHEHIRVANVGEYDYHPVTGVSYTHYRYSEILWTQTIVNSPLATNFSLSFSFLYASGPLDPSPYDFSGDVELMIYINTDGYYLSLSSVESRDTWYFISEYPIYVPSAPSSFNISFGLYVYTPSGNLVLSPNGDYDDDGFADGLANAMTLDLRLDDIALDGIETPGFEEVDMRFHAGEMEVSIAGAGAVGSATIVNPAFWITDSLPVEVTSNTSISFSYSVTLLLHQYENSSWAPDPSKPGVLYTVSQGQSALLRLYTYVAASYGYVNATIHIEYPSDWDNVTVLDPLLNDLTTLCDVSEGMIGIPNSLLGRVGWWEIRLDAPNYSESLIVQSYSAETSQWSEASLFRAGNETRVHAELGTATSTPAQGQAAQISWVMPNGTVWREESIETMVYGAFNGTTLTLAGENTTAGRWALELFWTNGTEIAFAAIGFDMYHSSSLTAIQSIIETEAGSTVTNIVRYTDTDNGEYLMQEEALLAANWSGIVTYDPNLVRSWWEGDFDTSILGGGEFVVVVNASQSYYDDASCQFILRVFYQTILDVISVGGTLATTSYLEIYTFYLSYAFANSTPVNGADIMMEYMGPESGILPLGWDSLGGGNYSFSLQGVVCGLYAVTVTAAKEYHYSASDTFTLLVAEANTVLSSPNGTSGLVRMGETYRLVVHHENSSGGGMAGANVVLDGVTPSSGLSYGNFTYAGNGDYYIVLTPTLAATYTLVIRASLYNHVERVAAFTLTAMVTPTILTVSSPGATVAIDQTYTVQLLLLDDEANPVDGASVTALNPPSGLFFQNCVPLPGGRYNITIQPLQTGTYQIAFRASCENYQYSTVGFTLIVGYIPTSLTIQGGVSSDSVLSTEDCEITVVYLRTDLSQAIEGADFVLTSTPDTGLRWQVANTTDGYRLTLRTDTVGIWMIFVSSNKTGYVDGFVQFELEVTRIPATINEISLVDDLVYGKSYNFTFNYIMYNLTGIEDANASVWGLGAEWVQVTETGEGHYRASIAAEALGTYSLTLVFEREGYETKTSAFSFIVVPASMSIVNIEGLNALEGENTTLSLRLVETDTGHPITGATVLFQIITPAGSGEITPLQEVSAGRYEASFTMSSFGTSDRIRIYASLDNHELDAESYEEALNPLPSESAQLGRTVSQASPFIFVLVLGIVGLSVRRVSTNRKRKRNIKALNTKRRFDDMKSLIGIIVLHKDSGIPVFSRILKSGLDESLISGFIAAISQFRLEFGVDEAEWAVVPISDIIRVVKTKNLLCAFITLGSPNASQEEKLLQFAKSVGLMFDSTYDSPPNGVVDHEILGRYEDLFDDLLDGHLLDDYRFAEEMKVPRNLRKVAEAASQLENPERFGLEALAREMANRGLDETNVYVKIADAIDKHYLVPLPSEVNGHSEAADTTP